MATLAMLNAVRGWGKLFIAAIIRSFASIEWIKTILRLIQSFNKTCDRDSITNHFIAGLINWFVISTDKLSYRFFLFKQQDLISRGSSFEIKLDNFHAFILKKPSMQNCPLSSIRFSCEFLENADAKSFNGCFTLIENKWKARMSIFV